MPQIDVLTVQSAAKAEMPNHLSSTLPIPSLKFGIGIDIGTSADRPLPERQDKLPVCWARVRGKRTST